MTNTPRLLIDQETGELVEHRLVELSADVATPPTRGKKPVSNDAFVMIWPAAILRMPRISSKQMAVFQTLASWMNAKTGVAEFYLDELCDASGVENKTTASAYVSILIKRGYARRLRNGRVQINPNLTWRGDKGNRNIALFRWEHPGKDDEFTLEATKESA